MMVSGSIGAGVAVAGTFSLVRFRSEPGTARQIAALFLSVALGMGYAVLAGVFFLIVTLFFLLLTLVGFGGEHGAQRDLRITIPENMDYEGVFDDLFAKYTTSHSLERVRTTNMGTLYEIRYTIVLKDEKQLKAFMDELRTRNGNLTIVCGRDEHRKRTVTAYHPVCNLRRRGVFYGGRRYFAKFRCNFSKFPVHCRCEFIRRRIPAERIRRNQMEQMKTELLVIGGGAAGLAAAAAAAEQGTKVIVTEAMAAVGGNGLFPRGVFAVDSVLQRKRLIFADTDEIFTRCMEYSHWKIDGRIVRRLLDKSGDTISWLMDKGVAFCDVVHHTPNQAPEVFHITSAEENAGSVVVRCLKQFCLEHGVTR